MAYIGNNLTVSQYTPTIAYFVGNGTATSFTLPSAVVSSAQVLVHVNNVPQNPQYAFTVSGTTLTFTSAPPANNTTPNNIWVEYNSLQTNTIAPSNGTVGVASINPANMIYTNGQTLNTNYTVPASTNGMVAGPFTVATGYVLTVSTGSRLVVV